ncbi:alpha-mannosyltransferase [Phlyctema vagabunda]|uniref:Alpha-mannosyltransferase n=1 Tax=Phlyctema vagabunda TaxID=108571 RepID=A0ABR4PVE2_9HELO
MPLETSQSEAKVEAMSTKVKALITDICGQQNTAKCVVFSFWTYTLDLVETMLNHHNIPFTRIDGKMNLKKRTIALDEFQKNEALRVILVSITCGGAGLDITAASRVYLLEPHWNPMIEEQAICRVHRVGQKQDVTTIRYVMKNTFEEQVVEIRKRKKLLAQVTFGQGPLLDDNLGMGMLEYLKAALE